MSLYQTLNFQTWINENRDKLKPPVGNKVVFPNRDFIVMVVGGPNERTDFHVNESEEFFYQLEGNMTLKVIDPEGRMIDIPIREGDIYLLPPNTPHSPQREAASIGLVIELRRKPEQMDALQWYCAKCTAPLYQERFHLTDIERQFQGVFQRYYDSENTKCKACGHQNGRKWNA